MLPFWNVATRWSEQRGCKFCFLWMQNERQYSSILKVKKHKKQLDWYKEEQAVQ